MQQGTWKAPGSSPGSVKRLGICTACGRNMGLAGPAQSPWGKGKPGSSSVPRRNRGNGVKWVSRVIRDTEEKVGVFSEPSAVYPLKCSLALKAMECLRLATGSLCHRHTDVKTPLDQQRSAR